VPESVVLTESRANLYFPYTKPEAMLNKTITYYGQDTVTRTVTGIVADYDTPSEFAGQEFVVLPRIAYETYQWTNTNGTDRLYLQFGKGVNLDTKRQQINELDARHWAALAEEQQNQGKTDAPPRGRTYELLPIRDVHFATHVSE